jgi:hypothetical protein
VRGREPMTDDGDVGARGVAPYAHHWRHRRGFVVMVELWAVEARIDRRKMNLARTAFTTRSNVGDEELVGDDRGLGRLAAITLGIRRHCCGRRTITSIGDRPHGPALRAPQICHARNRESGRDFSAPAIRAALSVHWPGRHKQQSSRLFQPVCQ